MGPAVPEHRGLAGLWGPYEQRSSSPCLDVVVKLSAILEDHAQRVLHPEWAAPAVLEDCGLESLGSRWSQLCARLSVSHRHYCETICHFGELHDHQIFQVQDL